MKAVVVSAASIALVGTVVSAQEAGQEASASQNAPPLAAALSASQARWTELPAEASSLLTQLIAVVRARRAAALAEAGLPENGVQITAAMSDEIASSAENCRVMPAPGSRIHTERCFNETEAEKRLNDYQFDEELRFSRQEAARQQLEEGIRASTMGGNRAPGGVQR